MLWTNLRLVGGPVNRLDNCCICLCTRKNNSFRVPPSSTAGSPMNWTVTMPFKESGFTLFIFSKVSSHRQLHLTFSLILFPEVLHFWNSSPSFVQMSSWFSIVYFSLSTPFRDPDPSLLEEMSFSKSLTS